MSWLLFGLMAPAVYTLVNYADKYIISADLVEKRGMPHYGAIVGLLFGTLYWAILQPAPLPPLKAGLALLAGALTTFGTVLYFQAMALETASRIIVWLQLTPILVLGLSWLFLGEMLKWLQWVGFLLILASAVGFTLSVGHQNARSKWLSRPFWLLIASDLLWAISTILLDSIIGHTRYSPVIALESWGIGLGAMILAFFCPNGLSSFRNSLNALGFRRSVLVFLNESGYLAGKLLTLLALAFGPAALVSVLASTQVFFGLVFGWLVMHLAPGVFEEDTSKTGRIRAFALSFLMFGGVWLVQG
ncbi:MAG: EamA family transporter [Solirubrobacterales bacterium]